MLIRIIHLSDIDEFLASTFGDFLYVWISNVRRVMGGEDVEEKG